MVGATIEARNIAVDGTDSDKDNLLEFRVNRVLYNGVRALRDAFRPGEERRLGNSNEEVINTLIKFVAEECANPHSENLLDIMRRRRKM